MDLSAGQIVACMGGASVVAAGVSSFFSKMVIERVLSKWRRDEQTLVEVVKADLASERVLLESSTRGFQSGIDANQPKRLASIERLWAEVLRLRGVFSFPVFFCTIFVPDEYADLLRNRPELFESLRELDSQTITTNMKESNKLENERPYLGETLWLQFFLYRAFLGRLTIVLTGGLEKGRITDWRKDQGIMQILSNALPADNVKYLLEKAVFIMSASATLNALESNILKEMSLIVSGRRSSFESFENAKELQEAIAKMDRPSNAFGTSNIQ